MGLHHRRLAAPSKINLHCLAYRRSLSRCTTRADLDLAATPSRRCPTSRRSRRCRRSILYGCKSSRRCPTCRRSPRCRNSTFWAANPSRLCSVYRRSRRCRRSTSGTATSLTALPDLSASNTSRWWSHLPNHLTPWKAGGFKALGLHHRRLQTLNEIYLSGSRRLPDRIVAVAVHEAQTLDQVTATPSRRCPTFRRSRRCRRSTSMAAHPSRRCPTCRRSRRCRRSAWVPADPSRRCPTCRRSRRCSRSAPCTCKSLTALPDTLVSSRRCTKLDLYECNSLTARPDLSALTDLKVRLPSPWTKPWTTASVMCVQGNLDSKL